MRLANLDGRAVLLAAGTTALDVATASGPGLPARYGERDAFLVQKARTSDLVCPVAELTAALPAGPRLLPGDITAR